MNIDIQLLSAIVYSVPLYRGAISRGPMNQSVIMVILKLW